MEKTKITSNQKITPFLWFDNKAEEAMEFYTSVFKNSKKGKITHYNEAGAKTSGRAKGSVMTATFELFGQEFTALNGGPLFKFTEAVSFLVNCDTQEEVDYFWENLSEGGEQGPCGWLKDKFGLSWQIFPSVIGELLSDTDAAKSNRVMQAMLQMQKIEIKKLQDAYYNK